MLTHKAGDTLRWVCTRTEPDGSPTDLRGMTIDARLTRRGTTEVVGLEPVSTADPAQGEYVLFAAASQTSQWSAGEWRADVTFSNAAGVYSSQTFDVLILRKI